MKNFKNLRLIALLGMLPIFSVARSAQAETLTIAVKVVSLSTRFGNAILKERRAVRTLRKASKLWAPCDISFLLEDYSQSEFGTSESNKMRSEDDIRRVLNFAQSSDQAVIVAAGDFEDELMSVGGLTMKDSGGIVLSKMYASDKIMLAHELGHLLGLQHEIYDGGNLMYVAPNGSSNELTAAQCATARRAAQNRLARTLR